MRLADGAEDLPLAVYDALPVAEERIRALHHVSIHVGHNEQASGFTVRLLCDALDVVRGELGCGGRTVAGLEERIVPKGALLCARRLDEVHGRLDRAARRCRADLVPKVK